MDINKIFSSRTLQSILREEQSGSVVLRSRVAQSEKQKREFRT